jgi:HAMP domain-containing protein
VLARLRVGTKLLLLVLVPVCVLLAFTALAARTEWRHASDLRQATARAAGWKGTLNVAQTLDAARRQLHALRPGAATTGTTAIEQADDSYSRIVNNLLGTVGNLDVGRPTQASGRSADAYLAILQAIEDAERERVDLAEVLGRPARARLTPVDPWATLEANELDAFRKNAGGRLTDELDASLFQPASIRVQELRDRLMTDPRTAVQMTSLEQWLSASGGTVGNLRHLEGAVAGQLGATVSGELGAAQASVIRDLGLSLAVLVTVTALGLLLRRSITRPLRDVSEGARTLSKGDLTFEVGYTGHDEIGDVAAALSDLRVLAESRRAFLPTRSSARWLPRHASC